MYSKNKEIKTDFICTTSCFFLPWNREEDIELNVQAATFHTMKVNGDWPGLPSYKKAKNALDIVHKPFNLEYSIRVKMK